MYTISKLDSLVCLFGPTAVGKTQSLLRLLPGKGEVIIADSIQVYRGMDIGSAKPTPKEQNTLPHHLIDILSPDETFSVGDFCRRAQNTCRDITNRDLVPVISGGTAFYFKNFLFGMPSAPPSNPQDRDAVEALFQNLGASEFFKRLEQIDPLTAHRLGSRDYYRQKRAYEVYLTCGKPLSSFQVVPKVREDLNILLIGLTRPREDLGVRIDKRVDQMVEEGLLNEVKKLVENGFDENSPGMKGIGYSELLPLILRQEGTLEDAIAQIKIHSRQYAKRQMTFFKSIPGVNWVDADSIDELDKLVLDFLENQKG